ncbi:hypothetical protein FRC07_009947 [Ceratobasidium sp. 392]|nr:hypothetical protein FRC07_009947 [Ceratobasidium sp. 392]
MTTPWSTTAPVGLRRRTTPLETAHAATRSMMLGAHSRLPSPPNDEVDISSDDTITASGKKSVSSNGSPNGHSIEFTSGVPSDRSSPIPSITSRLSSAAATRGTSTPTSSLHSPQTTPTHHRRVPSLSPSDTDSDEDDTHTITDVAYSQAHISSTSAWADLPILITFVSPAVALLTGGDYLRDVLLTCFLVWYLHQLIKVPWDIYLASLPPPSSSFAPQTSRRKRHRLAFTHLRTTRILALLLSALTPFLGAWLLNLGTSLLSADSLSWFSMSLFVLAAGVRPWRHLTHLLLTRTDALHLAAHQPSHLRPAFLSRLAGPYQERERVKEMERGKERARIEALENELAVLKAELNSMNARTRMMTKTLKDVERRAVTVQGRVEVLERHGNGMDQAGVWDGLGMIGAGVINVMHGLLCVVFPFMAVDSPGSGKHARTASGGKKKAKKLRGAVNNLPPVPEADESLAANGLDANGIHLDGMGKNSSGVFPPKDKSLGVVGGIVDNITWPMRVMRGVLMGFVKGVASRS